MKDIEERFGECFSLNDGRVDALVTPRLGMSLVRFSVEGEQLLDLRREQLFLEYRKGLGPIILPFFGQRRKFPELDYERFPHVEHLRKSKVRDPFQHGVGRYASWIFEEKDNKVTGFLRGDDLLHGYKLRHRFGDNSGEASNNRSTVQSWPG